jgi:Rieske 2Fe-2S family protein
MERKRSAERAKSLAAKYYTSPEIFDLETQRIFNRHWLCAGRVSEVSQPGQCLPVEIDGESLILVCGQDGQVRGFYNVCRHRGTRLCEQGTTVKKSITCPYHGWAYGLDGGLVAAPNMSDVDDFQPAELGLRPVATHNWYGFLFVNFSSEASFDATYGALAGKFDPWSLGELISVSRRTYDIAANWKFIFQNYNECYHCPRIHPALNALSSFKTASNDLEQGPVLGGPMQLSDQINSMTTTGQACSCSLPGLGEYERRRVFYYSLFPTLLISPHPDYVMVHRVERQTVDSTRVICEFLFHPEAVSAPQFDPSPAIEFWDETNWQDWHVCELSQQGISSRGYQPGPYANLECTVAAFDRFYLEVLGSD